SFITDKPTKTASRKRPSRFSGTSREWTTTDNPTKKRSTLKLKICIPETSKQDDPRNTAVVSDVPAPLKRQDAMIGGNIDQMLPPLPPPPPPPPSPSVAYQNPLMSLFAARQASLPFSMSYHRCPYGLHPVSLLLCRYCLDETSKRICITDGATERMHLSLVLCKQCVASNKEMQATVNNVWSSY